MSPLPWALSSQVLLWLLWCFGGSVSLGLGAATVCIAVTVTLLPKLEEPPGSSQFCLPCRQGCPFIPFLHTLVQVCAYASPKLWLVEMLNSNPSTNDAVPCQASEIKCNGVCSRRHSHSLTTAAQWCPCLGVSSPCHIYS